MQPAWLAHLLEAIQQGTISGKMAKELFIASIEQQKDPQVLIQEQGLRQIVDIGQLEQIADAVLAENAPSVDSYRKGKANALMFLVGQGMRRSQGKANPQQMTEILKRKLDRLKEAVS
jgi:aspartyl-tRNA(Asn)/glutamyl-tRNA(Gln) amidotransferase subunit B